MTLVMGRVVLMYLGSDYNGINATSNQIISILAILEGDFSTASLTSLFEPLNKKDYKTVNGILSYSKRSFRRIAVLMLFSSLALLLIYTPTVKTQLDKVALYLVFVLSIMSKRIHINTYRIRSHVSIQNSVNPYTDQNKEYNPVQSCIFARDGFYLCSDGSLYKKEIFICIL